MNRFFNIATLLVSTIILFAATANALTPVSNEDLRTFTGQAGMSLEISDRLGIDWKSDKIIFGDTDGTDGTPAFLSLNKVTYSGSVNFKNAVSSRVTTELDPYTGALKAGINLEMDGAVVEMDRFHIESITIDGAPGSEKQFANAGKSFGSITVEGFSAIISGKIRITSN